MVEEPRLRAGSRELCRLGHFGLRLHRSVCTNVADVYSVLGQDPPDEQMTVAVSRVLLAAQQCDPVASRATQQTLEASLKALPNCHLPVENVTFLVVEPVRLWPSTQHVPEEHIADVLHPHRRLERAPAKVWRVARVRT